MFKGRSNRLLSKVVSREFTSNIILDYEYGSLVSFSKQIVTFALTGVKYGRRRKTIVLYFEKSLNKHGSRSFMLIKIFLPFSFTAVSARLKT